MKSKPRSNQSPKRRIIKVGASAPDKPKLPKEDLLIKALKELGKKTKTPD